MRVVPTTGSTNADLGARARAGEAAGSVLVSMEQTAGRGRLDRAWASPPGSSIAMSLLLRPRPAFPQWGWLSLLAGMAVAAGLGWGATGWVAVGLTLGGLAVWALAAWDGRRRSILA